MQNNEITTTTHEGAIVIRVDCPDFGEQQAQALLEQLLGAAEQSPTLPVLLDMTKVAAMPSMAIGVLVTIRKRLQESQQRFILVGLQAPVRNTLAVCRLDKLFEFSDNEEQARIRLQPPAI